jgi:hypothetical protein
MAYGDHDGTPYLGQVVTYVLSQEEYNRYGVQSVSATIKRISTATCVDLNALVNVPPQWQKSAPITSFSITGNVVTVIAANNFANGDIVTISGLGVGTYLNGQNLTVIVGNYVNASGQTVVNPSGTQFAATFTHADVGSTSDSGTAKQVQANLTPRNSTFGLSQGNWYTGTGTVLPSGSPW